LRGGLELLGPIVRLQVQTSSLKVGDRPHRWYDPVAITPVERLRLDQGGVTGIDATSGDDIGDVHHRDHPASKFRSENGLSFGFTSHYSIMREQYGDRLQDGIAGENILIASDRTYPLDAVQHGLVIATKSGMIAIDAVQVAAPCAEFSKFALGYAHDQAADRTVTETIQFLHEGVRGFYATLAESEPPVVIRSGDLVYRRESS
jgi:hypothetical protein